MTKRTFLLITFVALLAISIQAQTVENQWLEKNYYEVSADATQQNFSDLQFLKSELKDKKIIAIGEQTHKDGSSFEARNRLIQFLISEMGYEAILFEAGIFDVAYGANLTQQSRNMVHLRRALYGFWSVSKQNQTLFPFLKTQLDKGKNIQFDGFDCKLTSYYKDKYLKKIDSCLQVTDNKVLENPIYIKYFKVWQSMFKGKKGLSELPKLSKQQIDDFKTGSDFVSKTLVSKLPFESQMVRINDKGILIYANQSVLSLLFNKKKLHRLNNSRDVLMAENLNYLLEHKYKDKKVILFGATYHFVKNNQAIQRVGKFPIPIETSEVMGDLLDKKYQKGIYTIGFMANKGKYGWGDKTSKIKPATKNSIEKYLLDNKKKDGILLLKNYNQNSYLANQNFTMRLFNYESSTASKDWSKILDAVFFIDEMKPVEWTVK